jgi:hypothetical protein
MLRFEQYVPTSLATPTDKQGQFRGQLYTRNSMNGNVDENLLVSHVSFRFVYAAFHVSARTVGFHVNVFTSVTPAAQNGPIIRLTNIIATFHRFTCYRYASGPCKISRKP